MVKVFLKKAEWADVDLLFEWTNDREVRENSFKSTPIEYENHKQWFRDCIRDSKIEMYICYSDTNSIGQVRLNIAGNDAQISYSISKEYRGQGFGKIIIQLLETEIRNNYPAIRYLSASVKINNIASQKIFETLGYERCSNAVENTYFKYCKKVNCEKEL